MYQERLRLGAALLLSFALVEFIVFGGLGIGVPVVVIIFYALTLWQLKGEWKEKVKSKWLIPIFLVTLCFALFDNEILKGFNFILLFALIILHISELFHLNPYEAYTSKWFLNELKLGLVMPFEKFKEALKEAKAEGEVIPNERSQGVKKVLIGVLISLPMLLGVGFLLMRADAAFEGIMDCIFGQFELDLFYIFTRTITVLLLFIPCAGFFRGIQQPQPLPSFVEGEEQSKWKLDFTIGMTIGTLLVGLYVVYCMAQLSYFVSAFAGILPSNFTYAEYARRGFFEMLPIACLNIGIIAGLNLFVEGKDEQKKAKWMKGYSLFFIGFTIFIIVTALSKMILYVGTYGLTIKRVYVTWFLILGLVSIVLIGMSLFKSHFKLMKKLTLTFICLYLGLNYCNIDYWIGKYNAYLYHTTGAQVEDSFWDLSASSIESLLTIDSAIAKDHITIYQNHLDYEYNWESWNLASYKANRLLQQEVNHETQNIQ